MSLRLTPEQRAIVEYPRAPLRVAAGAGTGKTTTIVMRLEALVSAGIDPEMALGITFTNKAAAELADRLRLEFPDLAARGRQVQVATYHGFAYEVLREFGAYVGVERDTQVIGPAHQRHLLERGLEVAQFDHLDLTNPQGVVNKALTLAGQIGDNLLDVAHVRDAAPRAGERDEVWDTRVELLSIVEAYAEAKASAGVVDYADLVDRAHRLVTDHPTIAARIRDRYRVVLLDEYQDTDPAQRELLRAIFRDGFPVTAVGDADQTIYEWRGASRLNFDGFARHFPNPDGSEAETLPLTLNRRSDRLIIDLGNRVRARLHGDEPFDRLEPGPAARDGVIETGWFGTRDDEAVWVADRIAAVHAHGTPWSEVAVLARRNRDLAPIRGALLAAGVPTDVASVGGLLDVPEVADLVAWLRLLDDPADSASFGRILLGSGYRLGLGDLAPLAGWVRRHRRRTGTEPTLIDAADTREATRGCSESARRRIDAFLDRYRRLLVAAQGNPVPELCRTILADIDAWTEIEAMERHAGRSARLNLYRFLDLSESWRPPEGSSTLGAFLLYLRELSDENAPSELDTVRVSQGPAVSLLTIHRAKGLEWDVVIIPSVVDGGFPSRARSYPSPVDRAELIPYSLRLDAASLPDLERARGPAERRAMLRGYHEAEEWRAAYVAVTRARHHLIVTGSHRTPERKTRRDPSALFAMARDLATAHVFRDDPGPVDEPEWEPPGPTPDPLFREAGWIGALRDATLDAKWLRAYPRYSEAAMTAAHQMRLDIEGIPRPRPESAATPQTVSVTGLVSLARCPQQFQWAFVDRLPTRPSPAQRRGVELHRMIEHHNRGKIPLGGLAGDPGGFLTVADASSAVGPSPFDVFLQSRLADQLPRFAEVPIVVAIEGVRVRGRIDAVYEPENGFWEIVDYKSGRASDDEVLEVQLQTYAVAAADGAIAEPAPERMAVTFAFFGGGAYSERSVVVNDRWLESARRRIAKLTLQIERGDFPTTPSVACHRCDFSSFCSAGQRYLNG